ncbi:MAG: hypothetical protein EOO09_13190 [Chitinophagaceae bacterium]|nr:MAG: hypothetical protein EOO09_13190 [Chitinophagaceae bacterium]
MTAIPKRYYLLHPAISLHSRAACRITRRLSVVICLLGILCSTSAQTNTTDPVITPGLTTVRGIKPGPATVDPALRRADSLLSAGRVVEAGEEARQVLAGRAGANAVIAMQASGILATINKITGNSKAAFEYLQVNKTLNDSLTKKYFKDETERLQTGLSLQAKDREIELLGKDRELQQYQLRRHRILTIVAVIAVLLVLAGIVLLVNRSRLRQRVRELRLRNQIAADLHDEVGSSLSSIHLLSQVASSQPGQSSGRQEIFSKVSRNARETMEKMSDIVWMIKPGENESLGMSRRMERFLEETCTAGEISSQLHGTEVLGRVKLDMEQRKNFYLVFKGAVSNAVRFSGTDQVNVIISFQDKQLGVTVTDTGKGFDPATAPVDGAIARMQQRARELGGTLTIDSGEGRGTTVILRFPV